LDFVIAVPSYKRFELAKTTITLLKSYNLNSEIYVFLNNEVEVESYKGLEGCKLVNSNCTGIQSKRNFIFNYFRPDRYVVCFDDSFNGLLIKKGKRLEPFNKMLELIKLAKNEMQKNKTALFGVNISENPFWMKNNISFKNQLICSKFYGFISQTCNVFHSRNPYGLCEDQETSLRCTIKFGGSVRFDMITFNKPNYGKISGGMQAVYSQKERKETEKKSCFYLSQKFPELCSIKKGGVGLRYKKIKK